MANTIGSFAEREHQSAYIFDYCTAVEGRRPKKAKSSERPPGRKSTNGATRNHWILPSPFVPLFQGHESQTCCVLRQKLFVRSWGHVAAKLRHILRGANRTTIKAIESFVNAQTADVNGRDTGEPAIPAAFILSGPNIASQDLLFDQLGETLNRLPDVKAVRLRSTDAPNLKAVLKKILSDVLRDDDAQARAADESRYLQYDLDILCVPPVHQVSTPMRLVVCLQDSEAFEAAVVADLIALLNSYADTLNIVLILGVATSVDLFQARLPRATCRSLLGRQFDVSQSSENLQGIINVAIAASDAPGRLAGSALLDMLRRHQDQVAGVHALVSSIKYAYMCHFYANPLSVLCEAQSDHSTLSVNDLSINHIRAIRQLPSYRHHIEKLILQGRLSCAKGLIQDRLSTATYVLKQVRIARPWSIKALRCLALTSIYPAFHANIASYYVDLLSGCLPMTGGKEITGWVKQLSAEAARDVLGNLLHVIEHGFDTLGLRGWLSDSADLATSLRQLLHDLEELLAVAQERGLQLRSNYNVMSRVTRTTMVARKAQLSQDTRNVATENQKFTDILEALSDNLEDAIEFETLAELFANEAWLVESPFSQSNIISPHAGRFLEHAFMRVHEYLCPEEQNAKNATGNAMLKAPAVSVLYRLYLDAGPLINVSDLWIAFENSDNFKQHSNSRQILALFYSALAEFKAMGFLKPTKRKVDHVLRTKHLL